MTLVSTPPCALLIIVSGTAAHQAGNPGMASPVLSPKVLPVTHLSPVLPTVSAPLPETCAAQHPRAGRDARARARAREARDFRKGWHAQECIRVCVPARIHRLPACLRH